VNATHHRPAKGDHLDSYLETLVDLLPPEHAQRARRDVESMVLDRVDAERASDPALDEDAALQRALAALGPPESLAEDLVASPLTIPLATRRLFVRTLAVVFAGHLLLSVVLTVAGGRTTTAPTLLGPLPTSPAVATGIAILSIFLMDAGALLVLFWCASHAAPARRLLRAPLPPRFTKKDAWQSLLLGALIAVILLFFVDSIFAVSRPSGTVGFLADELKAALPYGLVPLTLFALRAVLVLVGGREALALLLDGLACLATAAVLAYVVTRGRLVELGGTGLPPETALVLTGLMERVLLFVGMAAALYSLGRGLTRLARARRRFAASPLP
jgi:hypothetical protein